MANERTLEEIQKAIGAHGLWKLRLKTAINSGSSDFSPDVVACDNKCDFGKWLHDDSMPADIKGGMPYQVITRLHAEFHRTASTVLQDALDGNTAKSKEKLEGEFAAQSTKLISALNKWKGELREV